MGQVFTWQAVSNGDVPSAGDFAATQDDLRGDFPLEESVIGGLLCGSILRRDATIRSDLDCFVLYDVTKQEAAGKFMQRASAKAASRHVPLTFIPCDSALAMTDMHHVGSSFRRHLSWAARSGGVLKSNPLEALGPGVDKETEIEMYFRTKLYNLQEAWSGASSFSEERFASYLKKLLEAPMHIARKTLDYRKALENDSKTYIRSLYRKQMPADLTDQFEDLLALDASYTSHLVGQLESPDEEAYRAMLGHLFAASGAVFNFIRSNATVL